MTDLYAMKKTPIKVSLDITGENLKEKYFKEIGEDLNDYRVRLIFGGTEIKSEHKLGQHNIKPEYSVQVMKIPLANNS